MIMKAINILLLSLAVATGVSAQTNGLTDMSRSTFAQMANVKLGAVRWTDGFWGERFAVFEDTTILSMWDTWNTPEVSHGFRNFEIAAGVCPGEHWGPPFHDGDVYKWLEGVAAVYAVNRNPKLDELMDHVIGHIAGAQREDGYIHTPVIIEERNKGIDTHKEDEKGAFANRLNFETYNLGHLMTAAIVHHRATGKRTLLDVAVKATDFLCRFYETASAELARNAICPSHYMGVVEMYRTTRNPRYLELSKNLIDIRGMVENGTDDNQDRMPFRDQKQAMGHAVRANYLYAGVADVYAETGEKRLMDNLESIRKDIVTRKMYITGACGALYDGTSPEGTCYEPDSIQKVHQSYGRPYQLPNSTAHNETCANIGNMLFNWRMFGLTREANYAGLVENCFYNSILSGISLDGKKYFYTNPLRISHDLPYTLRWPKERMEYISCFCCPPNTVRTLCEAQNYAYAVSAEGVWCNLYGGSVLETTLPDGEQVKIVQTSDYPWDGNVRLTVEAAPKKKPFSLFVRIPEWCGNATLTVNGEPAGGTPAPDTYAEIRRVWNKRDAVELVMPMEAVLMEAHPLVEENRNQVAVKRGPLVYCLESIDIEGGKRIDDVLIPTDIELTPKKITIGGSPVVALEGTALLAESAAWEGTLYRPVSRVNRTVNIRLIPYYAWGNRGKAEMTVWMPVSRQTTGAEALVIQVRADASHSLSAALRQARELRRLKDPSVKHGVTICLEAGDHTLYEPVFIRPEDSGTPESPTVIRSAPGGQATLHGGVRITGWRKQGKRWVADAPEFNGCPTDFRQMWVNGKKAVRARDVEDFEQMNRIIGYDPVNRILWTPAEAVRAIRQAPRAEMVIHQMWCIANLRIKSVEIHGDSAAIRFHDPESRIQFEHPWPRPMVTGDGRNSAFYLTNAMELLDRPGEWFHDIHTRRVYYYPRPGEDMTQAEVTAPAIETLVQVTGTLDRPVRHVRFEQVGFACTTWMRPSRKGHVPLQAGMYLTDAYRIDPQMERDYGNHRLDNQGWLGRPPAAVQVYAGQDIDFTGCEFRQLASGGLDYVYGTKGGVVEDCLFRDIGGSAVIAGTFAPPGHETHIPYDPADRREICTFLQIRNNRITDATNEDWGCVGILAGYVSDITIARNEISEVSYTGISLGWGWTQTVNCMRNNTVHANHIHHYGKHLYDTAGIYTLSAQPKTSITGNRVHSIYRPGYAHDPNHWFHLYTDEGSSFITVKDNQTEGEKYLRNANGPGNVWENNGEFPIP
jgi:DUF1680 family protein